MKTVQFTIAKHKIKVDCNSTEFVPAYFHYLLLAHHIKHTDKVKIIFNDQTVRLKKIDGEYIYLKGFDYMPDNATAVEVDCTEELVKNVEPTDGSCKCEAPESRNLNELMSMSLNEMTKGEVEYLISALKVKAEETDKIAQRAFKENRDLRAARQKDLKLMEDTLTFIKTTVGNAYGSICLAIKNMETEVK